MLLDSWLRKRIPARTRAEAAASAKRPALCSLAARFSIPGMSSSSMECRADHVPHAPTFARMRGHEPRSRSPVPGQAATPPSCVNIGRSIASDYERVDSPARKADRGGAVCSADSFHDGGGRPQSPTVARIQSFFLRLVFYGAYRNSSRHRCSAALLRFRPGISCTAEGARTFAAPDSS